MELRAGNTSQLDDLAQLLRRCLKGLSIHAGVWRVRLSGRAFLSKCTPPSFSCAEWLSRVLLRLRADWHGQDLLNGRSQQD